MIRGTNEVTLPAFAPWTHRPAPDSGVRDDQHGPVLWLLLTFYPYRRKDGEVMVLFMFCYACHRFLDEMLRIDTEAVAFQMTLSQNISLLVLAAAVVLALILWRRPVQYQWRKIPFRRLIGSRT